jgi:hypothetical protein
VFIINWLNFIISSTPATFSQNQTLSTGLDSVLVSLIKRRLSSKFGPGRTAQILFVRAASLRKKHKFSRKSEKFHTKSIQMLYQKIIMNNFWVWECKKKLNAMLLANAKSKFRVFFSDFLEFLWFSLCELALKNKIFAVRIWTVPFKTSIK